MYLHTYMFKHICMLTHTYAHARAHTHTQTHKYMLTNKYVGLYQTYFDPGKVIAIDRTDLYNYTVHSLWKLKNMFHHVH